MTGLEGKSIIVTGGASGMGRQAAILGAARGARVTLADLDGDVGEEVAAQIRADGGQAQFVATDISNEDQVRAMVTAATDAHGPLNGAFNNAGLPPHSSARNGTFRFADMPTEAFRRRLEVNVVGTFLCMKHELAAMLQTGGGSIVNTSSAVGLVAIPAASDYVSSKHAIIGLTKAAALDYATSGIRVNAVLPGPIRTAMLYDAGPQDGPELSAFVDALAATAPVNRLGEPQEVAEAVLWLLSDAASYMTGSSVSVDGGQVMV